MGRGRGGVAPVPPLPAQQGQAVTNKRIFALGAGVAVLCKSLPQDTVVADAL